MAGTDIPTHAHLLIDLTRHTHLHHRPTNTMKDASKMKITSWENIELPSSRGGKTAAKEVENHVVNFICATNSCLISANEVRWPLLPVAENISLRCETSAPWSWNHRVSCALCLHKFETTTARRTLQIARSQLHQHVIGEKIYSFSVRCLFAGSI